MENQDANLLTAIVPLTSNFQRVNNVIKILQACDSLPITLIVVFDSEETLPVSLETAVAKRFYTTKMVQGFWKNPGESRNAGLSYLSTKWVTFWDSDDQPDPTAVLKMVELAESENADCSVGGAEIEFFENLETLKLTPKKTSWSESALRYPGLWRFAFNRQLVQNSKFNRYSMGEDQDFLARLLTQSSNIFVTDHIVYKYRADTSEQLTKNTKNVYELLFVFDNLRRLQKSENRQVNRLISVMKAKIAATALIRGSWKVKVRMSVMFLEQLSHFKAFSRGGVGTGVFVAIRSRIKRD